MAHHVGAMFMWNSPIFPGELLILSTAWLVPEATTSTEAGKRGAPTGGYELASKQKQPKLSIETNMLVGNMV